MFVRIVPLFLMLAALVPDARAATKGAPVWTNLFDGPGNSADHAFAIAADAGGDVFVTGLSWNSFNPDFATIKYSRNGVPLWTNRYNGPGNGYDEARAMAVDGSGNVFVTGYSFGSGGNNDYATVAYSGSGALLWINRYNGPGNGTDYPKAIAVDTNGNVFVTGYSFGSGGYNDYATVAYSGSGALLWINRYNGPGSGSAFATAIAADKSGNVLVTGYAPGSGNDSHYATIKYSGAGVPLWTNRYAGQGVGNSYAKAVAVDAGGNVFVTGYSYGIGFPDSYDYVTVAYSAMGAPLWTNRYNGPGRANDYALAAAVDGKGNVFVTGYSANSTNTAGGVMDYATVAYSSAGAPLWTNRYNGIGNGDEFANAIAVDGGGNVFVTGYSDNVAGRYSDYATVAYSRAGLPLWTNRYGGPGNDLATANAIALDTSGNVFVTGESFDGGSNYDYATIKYVAITSMSSVTLTQVVAANGQFRFQLNADSNLTYAVEFRDPAGATNWVALTNLPAQPVATNLTFSTAMTNAARLYRVRTP